MDVIKSVAGDFSNGIDLSQFSEELATLTLTVTVGSLRIDGDALAIALSGPPSGADTIAIDGIVTAHDPAVETVEEAASAQAEVFGTRYAYGEDEDVRVRVTKNWSEVQSLAIPELEEDGVYRIGWFYEWSADQTRKDFVLRVQVNDDTDLSMHQQEPKESGGPSISGSGTDQRHVASGFRHVTLSGGSTPNIDIDIKGQANNYEVTLYRSRIEFWRVS